VYIGLQQGQAHRTATSTSASTTAAPAAGEDFVQSFGQVLNTENKPYGGISGSGLYIAKGKVKERIRDVVD
jgi:hypothetical protein